MLKLLHVSPALPHMPRLARQKTLRAIQDECFIFSVVRLSLLQDICSVPLISFSFENIRAFI